MLFVLYRDYLTGFHKRKVERQTKAKEEMKTMKREAKKMAKESVSCPFTLMCEKKKKCGQCERWRVESVEMLKDDAVGFWKIQHALRTLDRRIFVKNWSR